jgi:hypothetical protein
VQIGVYSEDNSSSYISLVGFMDYDLGYFDFDTRALEPIGKSARAETCYLGVRYVYLRSR